MVNFGPQIPKKYPPNLKNGPRGAKFPFSGCQNYTDKSISQIPPGGSKLGGWLPGQNQQTRGWRSSAWRNKHRNQNKRKNKLKRNNKKLKFHILCRIHGGSLLGSFLIIVAFPGPPT